MKYSFVLPAYKARFFKEAIDSILAQTYTEFELIIVNDASPEDLDAIVRSYDDPRIRYYVNEQNIGGKDLVAQWNHCLEYAQGEYVILASDDDVYFPHYLEKMDVLVCKYPDVNVFRPRVQIIDEQGELKSVCGCIAERVSIFEYWCYWGTVGSAIGHIIFRRSSLCEKGGFVNFPMGWGADDATILMMGDRGICFESDILYSFRMSGVNISSIQNDCLVLIKKVESRQYFYAWLKEFMTAKDAEDPIDGFYKNSALSALENTFQNNTLYLLHQCTFSTMLRVLPYIMKVEYISSFAILKWLLLRLF